MGSMVNEHLEVVEKAIQWVLDSLQGEKQKNAYRNVVNFRRKLDKKKFALESNPAAALFGESQVGKSYLVGSLLSESGDAFSIIDQDGLAHSFIEEINPPGGGAESTSLVTRFSTEYKPINLQYPIKAKLLSPADIVLALCDSFYNDIKVTYDAVLQRKNIENEIDILRGTLQNRALLQNVLMEDDVFDIQDYLTDCFPEESWRGFAFYFL